MRESKTIPRTQISLRLSNELPGRIQRLAEKERRNRSNMIEYLLREKMRETAKEGVCG